VGASSVDNLNGERRIYEGTDQRSTPVVKIMNHYIALSGKALSPKQTAAFYRRFRKSANALLEAYSQNVEQAKEAITQVSDGTVALQFERGFHDALP
jgi:hypothetical protein